MQLMALINPAASPPGGTLRRGSESEIPGSLNNLKREEIGLREKFNMRIKVRTLIRILYTLVLI